MLTGGTLVRLRARVTIDALCVCTDRRTSDSYSAAATARLSIRFHYRRYRCWYSDRKYQSINQSRVAASTGRFIGPLVGT